MKKLSAIVLVLGLLAVSGVSAWAFGGGHGFYARGPLSQEQAQELQNSQAAFMAQTQELRTNLATKTEVLATLYAQPSPDQARIKAVQDEIIDLRAQLAKAANSLQSQFSQGLYQQAGCGYLTHHGMYNGGHRGPGYGPAGYGGRHHRGSW